MGCEGSQEYMVLSDVRVSRMVVSGERYIPGCLHTCICVRSIFQRPHRVCVAVEAKRNFSSFSSLNYRTKEIVCI